MMNIPFEFETRNATVLDRLQERHKRIVDANIDAIAGKAVLDLASNNGRWSFAALEAGASYVVGVEGRSEKATEASRLLSTLTSRRDYRFDVEDMFDWLVLNENESVDTIFCLGVFYHVMDHHRLLQLMARTSATTFIIDSGFVRSFRNSVHVQTEDPTAHRNALQKFSGQKEEFAGFISLGLMIQMAWNLGFTCRPIIWRPEEVDNKRAVQDYMMGRRFTLRLSRTGNHNDKDWQESWREALMALNPKFINMFGKDTHDRAVDDRVRRPFQNMQFSVL